jgi:VWFA-related protein
MLRYRAFCAAVALAFTTFAVSAQQPGGAARGAHTPDVTNLTVPPAPQQGGPVRLDVEVAPKSGVPVQGLTQADFSVMDNGSLRPITGFRELSSAKEPVHVFLIFDAVNARFSTVAYERSGVEKFLSGVKGELPLPFTIGFLSDQGIQVQQGSSRDGKALSESIEANAPGLREINRTTGFWGADERMEISLKGIEQVIAYAAQEPGRKLVIYSTIAGYSTAMRQGGVTLYSLNPLGPGEPLMQEDYYQGFLRGVSKPSQTDLADLSVQVLAIQSGGQVMNSSNLGQAIQKLLGDADSWYELTLDPAPAEHANEYHHIEVKVNRPNLKVRTRDGYYDQPTGDVGR